MRLITKIPNAVYPEWVEQVCAEHNYTAALSQAAEQQLPAPTKDEFVLDVLHDWTRGYLLRARTQQKIDAAAKAASNEVLALSFTTTADNA